MILLRLEGCQTLPDGGSDPDELYQRSFELTSLNRAQEWADAYIAPCPTYSGLRVKRCPAMMMVLRPGKYSVVFKTGDFQDRTVSVSAEAREGTSTSRTGLFQQVDPAAYFEMERWRK